MVYNNGELSIRDMKKIDGKENNGYVVVKYLSTTVDNRLIVKRRGGITPQSTFIYRVPQCMSPRRNRTLPPPVSPASVPLHPQLKGGGGGILAYGWGVEGVPIPTTGEKLSTLSTLCITPSAQNPLYNWMLWRCDRLWSTIGYFFHNLGPPCRQYYWQQ